MIVMSIKLIVNSNNYFAIYTNFFSVELQHVLQPLRCTQIQYYTNPALDLSEMTLTGYIGIP
jgi:hypothetical protein